MKKIDSKLKHYFVAKIGLFSSIILLFQSCIPSLRTGDLLFQINDSNGFVDAILESTGDKEIAFSHVGILVKNRDSLYVIEATPQRGVCTTPLIKFDSTLVIKPQYHQKFVYGSQRTLPLRPCNRGKALRAVSKAQTYLGLPYDYLFLPNNNAIYCSELVYLSYLNSKGEPIFDALPMNFKDHSGNISAFWQNYFTERGEIVPQDSLGTNPTDIAKSILKKYHSKQRKRLIYKP